MNERITNLLFGPAHVYGVTRSGLNDPPGGCVFSVDCSIPGSLRQDFDRGAVF